MFHVFYVCSIMPSQYRSLENLWILEGLTIGVANMNNVVMIQFRNQCNNDRNSDFDYGKISTGI